MAIRQGIRLYFSRVLKESVDEDGALWCHIDRCSHIFPEHLLVMDYLHAPSSQNKRRTHHDWVADAAGYNESLFDAARHPRLRHRDTHLFHHLSKEVSILR